MSNTLIISFIRNVTNHSNDDALTIEPSKKSNTLYNIVYRDRLNNIRNKSICTEGEILDMVENVFNLLPHDKDPFNFIQITAPSFPPVLLESASLSNFDVRESIYCVVRNTLRNWPTATAMNSGPVTRSQTRASTA